MKYRIAGLLIVLSGLAVRAQYALWLNFENLVIGELITTNHLAAAAVMAPNLGYWTNWGGDYLVVSSNRTQRISGTFSIGNANYTAGPSTRSAKFVANRDSTYSVFKFNQNYTALSAGCWIAINEETLTFSTFDLFGLISSSGEFLAANLDHKPNAAQYGIRLHTHAGGTTTIALATNGTYWISLLWTNGGDAQLSIYNTNRSLIGTTNLGLNDVDCSQIDFGRFDDHDSTNTLSEYYFDNLVVSTNGLWPLPPPEQAPPTMGIGTINIGTLNIKQ